MFAPAFKPEGGSKLHSSARTSLERKSKSLLIPATDSWATPFEQSGLNQTPCYDETVAWLQKLVDAAPELKKVSIGTTLEGRDIVMILASSR